MSKTAAFVPMSVRIPEPCHADAAQMTIVPDGKFCSSCSQVVTDFTKMTDAQLLAWMRTYRGGCGSFRPDQLNRQLIVPHVRKAPFGMKWLLGLLILTGCVRDGDRKQPAKPQMERPLGAPAFKEHPTDIDSPMIMGEFIPPEPDTTATIPAIDALQDSMIEPMVIVQGGIAWEQEPIREPNDSAPSILTAGSAFERRRRDAATGFQAIRDSVPSPALQDVPTAEARNKSLWRRVFGRS